MKKNKSEQLFQMWLLDLYLIFRSKGGVLFWLPILLAGYALFVELAETFSIAPFYFFLLLIEPLFRNMLNRYPQELKYYQVTGTNLESLFIAKNLSLFFLCFLGALICGFGLIWSTSISLQNSTAIIVYFGMTIFPLLTLSNCIMVFRRISQTRLRCYMLYLIILLITTISYLTGWIYFKSYKVCIAIIIMEAVSCCIMLFYLTIPRMRLILIELIEAKDDSARNY